MPWFWTSKIERMSDLNIYAWHDYAGAASVQTEHSLRRESSEHVGTGLVEERHPREVVRRHHGRARRRSFPLLRHPLEGPVLEAAHRAHPRLLVGVHEAPVDPARHAVQLQGYENGTCNAAFL